MRGKKRIPKREIKPDPKYQSKTVAKLINIVMKNGKKIKAQKIVYNAFKLIKEDTKKDPLGIFNQAIKNIGPQVEIRPRRIGGVTYQIPVQVKGERKLSLALRWLVEAARSKKGKPMMLKLKEEIISAAKGEGTAVKKRENIEKIAEANKAFAHFA